jgi:hypothetical protein
MISTSSGRKSKKCDFSIFNSKFKGKGIEG